MAEKVMDYDRAQKDEQGEKTAKTMRDDYIVLYDKLNKTIDSNNVLTKDDYAKILVGTMIVINNIESRIITEKNAVQGYKIKVLPALQSIVDTCKTDEEAKMMAAELFSSNTWLLWKNCV